MGYVYKFFLVLLGYVCTSTYADAHSLPQLSDPAFLKLLESENAVASNTKEKTEQELLFENGFITELQKRR